MRGLDVAIPRDQRAPLEDDSVYIDDLIGCHIIDIGAANAGDIGPIASVDRETTSTPLLIVRTAGNKEELLIPFANAYLKKVDVNKNESKWPSPKASSPSTTRSAAKKNNTAERSSDSLQYLSVPSAVVVNFPCEPPRTLGVSAVKDFTAAKEDVILSEAEGESR